MDAFNDVKIANSKLKTTILIIPFAVTFDKVHIDTSTIDLINTLNLQEDLFSLERDGEVWGRLSKKAIVKELGNSEEVKESFKKIVKGILLANAMVCKGAE